MQNMHVDMDTLLKALWVVSLLFLSFFYSNYLNMPSLFVCVCVYVGGGGVLAHFKGVGDWVGVQAWNLVHNLARNMNMLFT